MKIGIDAHILGKNKGGVEVYIYNLIKKLQELDRNNYYTIYLNPGYDKKLIDQGAKNFNFKNIPFYSPWLRYFCSLPLAAKKDKIDLLHTQRAIPLWFPSERVVLTIHDVAHEVLPGAFNISNKLILKNIIKTSAKKAGKIITVSENSKNEIIKHFRVPANKITVAYNGFEKTDFQFSAEEYRRILKQYVIKEPFFIFVGAIEPRKNLEVAVEMVYLLKKDAHFKGSIVVIGGCRSGSKRNYYSKIKKMVKEKNLEAEVIFTGYQNEIFKNTLLSKATALIFPSFYEGFGLPALEAMRFNIPVILSRIPVFLEIIGDCALYADAYKPEEFFSQAKLLLESRDLALELGQKASVALGKFNWADTVSRHMQVYESFK